MTRFTENEKMELKLKLHKKIAKFMEEVTEEDNNIGWLPKEVESFMTNAAFNVLDSINALNVTLDEEGQLK